MRMRLILSWSSCPQVELLLETHARQFLAVGREAQMLRKRIQATQESQGGVGEPQGRSAEAATGEEGTREWGWRGSVCRLVHAGGHHGIG